MKKKIWLVINILGIGVGIFLLISGVLWASGFYIFWGVALISINVWQLIASRQKKIEDKEHGY